MHNTIFELRADNGGNVTLYIMNDGKAIAAYTELQLLQNMRNGAAQLRKMIADLAENPDAWKDDEWEGGWDEKETGITVSELYAEETEMELRNCSDILASCEENERGKITITIYPSTLTRALLIDED